MEGDKEGIYNNPEAGNNILERYLFVSVAMIKLSKKCVEIEPDLIETMQSVIVEAAQEMKIDLSEVHCAIMPSV